MKNLKSIVAILAISLSTAFGAYANDAEPKKENKELRTEIVKILGDEIPMEFIGSSKAELSFMINKNNEVVIVSVDSELSAFDSYVKRKLNYKKINTKKVKQGEIYILPVKINKSK